MNDPRHRFPNASADAPDVAAFERRLRALDAAEPVGSDPSLTAGLRMRIARDRRRVRIASSGSLLLSALVVGASARWIVSGQGASTPPSMPSADDAGVADARVGDAPIADATEPGGSSAGASPDASRPALHELPPALPLFEIELMRRRLDALADAAESRTEPSLPETSS